MLETGGRLHQLSCERQMERPEGDATGGWLRVSRGVTMGPESRDCGPNAGAPRRSSR